MAYYFRLIGHRIAQPTPAHTLTEGAEAARESLRRLGREGRIRRQVAALVTDHGNPKRVDYDGVRAPAAAKTIARDAEALGFEVVTRDHPTGCVVEGLHRARRVGFRAYWSRGTTKGATWHSGGRDRYRLVDISDRPVGVDANAKTTKAKHRHDERDTTRLELVESPRGVNVNVTELKRRIKG